MNLTYFISPPANYLKYYRPDTIEQLKAGATRAVKMYNGSKPHGSLPGRRNPDQFVKELIRAVKEHIRGITREMT
jgi:hypothetical protein